MAVVVAVVLPAGIMYARDEYWHPHEYQANKARVQMYEYS